MPSDLDERTLPSLLRHRAAEVGDAPFLFDDRGSLTWGEMWQRANHTGGALAELGVGHGDHVVLALENHREFVVAWFALACLGAVQVPVNPEQSGEPLLHVFEHTEARLAIVESSAVSAIDELADRLMSLRDLVVVGSARSATVRSVGFESIEGDTEVPVRTSVTGSDIASLMYTSGTTGHAKGVLLPHAQHHTNGMQAVSAASIDRSDRIAVCLPLHHNMAQGYGFWPALVSGASVHLMRRFDRHTFWDEIEGSGATVFPFVGGLLALLLDAPNSGRNDLRVAYGVPIPPALHREFERRFDLTLLHCYGSTEATIPVWADPDGDVGAAGRVIPEFDVRVLDPFDREVPSGTIGEICIRPRDPYTMFQGYHRDAERTVAAWRNLWFHSGDRGEFDESGQLWFRGRQSDVIRRFGEFIDPTLVEDSVRDLATVEAVVAYGVESDVAEEEVMVAVVPAAGERPTPHEIRSIVSTRLPRNHVPRFVSVIDSLPVTPTGKVQRHVLRARGVTDDTDDVRTPSTKGNA